METKIRDGIAPAFSDNAKAGSPLVLIHGWGCDHASLERQQQFFNPTHRAVSVDLRGHGQSDAPVEAYEVSRFADDIAWLCQELDIQNVILIGHSMGGSVAIEVAHRYPRLARAVGMIDTVFQPPPALLELLGPLLPALNGELYEDAYRTIMLALSLPSEQGPLAPLLRDLPRAPQHVLLSSLQQHLEHHDFAKAAADCSLPVAYIAASGKLADMEQLRRLIPHLMDGKSLGAGHFAPWLASGQLNAMLSRFVELVDSIACPIPRRIL